jgi:hypothetical protein
MRLATALSLLALDSAAGVATGGRLRRREVQTENQPQKVRRNLQRRPTRDNDSESLVSIIQETLKDVYQESLSTPPTGAPSMAAPSDSLTSWPSEFPSELASKYPSYTPSVLDESIENVPTLAPSASPGPSEVPSENPS